ncbi:C-type lectin domain family 2 member B-like [Pseudonaja textilis]|uniref:C-type lectin domain family 2 member B-like n=1 Tax=Pseudonaja textilis TaxID=8673 RepID=UPI000EA92E9D|nr:C-type lectin domain family 2 member B-like [Pseudonaja textilis]
MVSLEALVVGAALLLGLYALLYYCPSSCMHPGGASSWAGAKVLEAASPINKTTSNPDDCKLLLAASEPGRRPCPTDWIGFQTKCFYFSNKEETWSASRDFCSLNNASLPVIDDKEMDFVQRYKGSIPYWIGLQREPEQPWTWVNGSVSTLEVLGDGGNCAYLNDEGRPSSSRCSTFHQWICSKPDEFTRPKRV